MGRGDDRPPRAGPPVNLRKRVHPPSVLDRLSVMFGKKLLFVLALSVVSLATLPALAHGRGHGRGHGKEHGKFPMTSAEFKAKVDARTAKARQRLETRIARLPADQAKEARQKFDAGTAKIDQEVGKAIADGSVTKEEAQKVREVAKTVRPHGPKRAKR